MVHTFVAYLTTYFSLSNLCQQTTFSELVQHVQIKQVPTNSKCQAGVTYWSDKCDKVSVAVGQPMLVQCELVLRETFQNMNDDFWSISLLTYSLIGEKYV